MGLAENWNWQWGLNDHVMWIQTNRVNMSELDCGRWNEWNGLWTEGYKDETWTMKCRLKEIRWNMNSEIDNVTHGCSIWWFPSDPV